MKIRYELLGSTLIIWGSIMLSCNQILLFLEENMYGTPLYQMDSVSSLLYIVDSNIPANAWTCVISLGILIWVYIVACDIYARIKQKKPSE